MGYSAARLLVAQAHLKVLYLHTHNVKLKTAAFGGNTQHRVGEGVPKKRMSHVLGVRTPFQPSIKFQFSTVEIIVKSKNF